MNCEERLVETPESHDQECREASLTERNVESAHVVVVVPTLNEAENIHDCLHSILSDPWMKDVPVVVADGGSTDKTQEIVTALKTEFPNLSILGNPKRLQSAAINAVALQCTGPDTQVLVRCDAHATYPAGYVRMVTEGLLARPDAASLVTPMDATGTGCFQVAAAWVVDTPLGSGGAAHRGGRKSGWVDHGHHAGFRLDWFRRIGGYDESFSHNEDAEFDTRLTAAGGKIWLDADIRLDYRMRRNPRALARQYWNYGRGRARTVAKHRVQPRVRQLLPVANIFALGVALLLSPLIPALVLLPLVYCGVLALVSVVAVVKMRSLCGAWAGIALAAMHNAWGAGFVWHTLWERKAK